jgi:outer membrane protein TolC
MMPPLVPEPTNGSVTSRVRLRCRNSHQSRPNRRQPNAAPRSAVRQALAEVQGKIHRSFDIARDEYAAGSVSNLDLLTMEQSLVPLDAALASSDAGLIQLQIDLFKPLGADATKRA